MKEPTLAEFEQSIVDAIEKGKKEKADPDVLNRLSNMLYSTQIYRVVYQVTKI